MISLYDVFTKVSYTNNLNIYKNVFVKKVIYHKNISKIQIIIDHKFDLSKEEKEEIKNNLEKLLYTEITLTFNKLQYENKERNLDYIDIIKGFLLKEIPTINGYINDIDLIVDKNRIQIIFPSKILFEFYLKIKNKLLIILKEKKDIILTESYKEESLTNDFINEIKTREISIEDNIPIKKHINMKKKKNYTDISMITTDDKGVCIVGEVIYSEKKILKNNYVLIQFDIYDKTGTITCKKFFKNINDSEITLIENTLKVNNYIYIIGNVSYDTFIKSDIVIIDEFGKHEYLANDDGEEMQDKRIELSLHTKMSNMNGVVDIEKLMFRLKELGHEAVAITDEYVVQSFPQIYEQAKKHGIKVIYGMTGILVDDTTEIIKNYKINESYSEYVVFDIETTGLSKKNDRITEIGGVKIIDGKITDTFSTLVNPGKVIPRKIEQLTGITNEMVKNEKSIHEILPEFLNFSKDCVLVAHNAEFDMGFIKEACKRDNISCNNPYIDTLTLSRSILVDLKNHKLNSLTKYFKISLENHHRATDDATATAEIFINLIKLTDININYLSCEINKITSNQDYKKLRGNTITILVKNNVGLKNLYNIVSESHVNTFHGKPKIMKSFLEKNREGLLIGSGNSDGELMDSLIMGNDSEELNNIADFYDYIEIQPFKNLLSLKDREIVQTDDEIHNIIIKLINIAKNNNKIAVATGDVFYIHKEDSIFRDILIEGQGKFQNKDKYSALYYRTTAEMLNEFYFLDKELAKEIIIKNTNIINGEIEDIEPILEGTYPPVIEGSDIELRNITYNKTVEIYGENPPKIVTDRLEKELTSIISNGYSVLYIISQKLVKKSNDDGYIVGSRGSVGSSFAATMAGITEVNPLPPHYICIKCKYSEFFNDGVYESGIDLPDKNCPSCNSVLHKDGHEIPFEVFLGFDGDKEPDIDLNFAGEYQSKAHKYIEDLFGEKNVFRAGTIGTIASNTAYGYVKKYIEKKFLNVNIAEERRLISGIVGVKRASGQHPGGIMILPKDKNIHDFTPIQYSADDKETGVITTHFNYKAISGRILKLDILGHDAPSIIKMLEEFSGIDIFNIPLDDKETMNIFSGSENEVCSTLGIPEFGTFFVRQILKETKPSTFAELVRISGLSHGTGVWSRNAQELIKNNIAKLTNVIATRDGIMTYLIHNGIENKKSFNIMETVRKGKKLSSEILKELKENGIPDWYIDSCEKIEYMFPKAHAVAYVLMSYRIAYFKVHHPLEFYATYFSNKINDFPMSILEGKVAVIEEMSKIEKLEKQTQKESLTYTILEVAKEMFERGIIFKNVSLYESLSNKFKIDRNTNSLLPPLRTVNGISEAMAKSIFEEAKKSKFISIQDLTDRTKLNKTVLVYLKQLGILKKLSETNQLDFFDL